MRLFALLLLGLPTGCASPLDEGKEKLDNAEGERWSDTAPGDTSGESDTGEAVNTDTSVCYPGADGAYEACLPVVEWSASWGSDYDYPEAYQGSAQYAAPVRFIDLDSADPDMVLAPNFRLDELMQSWKGPYGLFQVHAVESLQNLRDMSGGPLNIYSGYRSVGYNESVEGVTHSRHMYGDASDMGSQVVSLIELGALCDSLQADYVGYYESHVHCDWRNDPLDSAFYESDGAVSDRASPPHSARLVSLGDLWSAPATGFDEGEPLRRWRAFDRSGHQIDEMITRDYTAPADAETIEVWIGGQLTLEVRP